jgi:hypothetical protein
MQNNSSDESEVPWPVGWKSHRENEIRETAMNSTFEQRFRALEEMLEMLKDRMPELIAARERAADRKYEPRK